MAESFFVLCRDVSWAQMAPHLDNRCPGRRHDDQLLWSHPAEDYLVLVYNDDPALPYHTLTEREEVVLALGTMPDVALLIELKRSRQNEACDIATTLALDIMTSFIAVADDDAGTIWTRRQIEEAAKLPSDRFLDIYRYRSP